MAPELYRAREAKARTALAAMVVAAGYHVNAHAIVRDALGALLLDGADGQGDAVDLTTRCNEAVADIAGNQAAAEFAVTLAHRDEPDTDADDLDGDSGACRTAWLREMLHQAGGLVGGYL